MTAQNIAEPKLANMTPKWQKATWDDYLIYRDNPNLEKVKLFFNRGYLFIDTGAEGINHSLICNLFPILFFIWFSRTPGQTFKSMDRCQLEKPNLRSAAPDQVLYIGENAPFWQEGERRRIDLTKWRVPDLVGEVSDTTLAADLDEKKALYAALGIPEYWVSDVRGKQVLAFCLQEDGKYQECEYSLALSGLPISLLEATLEKLIQGDHIAAGLWFSQQITNL